jgi:hypothetical protein
MLSPVLQLPKPYPDELLYSVFARYHAYIPPTYPLAAAQAYCGVSITARADLPDCLQEIASRTYPTWCLTPHKIASLLTLFPYYSAFAPAARAQRCFERLLGHNRSNAHSTLGIGPSVVKSPKVLRFCQTCRMHDVDEFGETYWHRTHQLPGVLVCPDHHCFLLQSEVAVRS